MSLLKDIAEAKIPANAQEWDEAELAAWQERFPKFEGKNPKEFREKFPKYEYRRQDDVVSLKLGESNLIKELSVVNKPKNTPDLKKSDASDAGSSDVVDKAKAGDDVSFSLMRNTINANGKVSGSDVTDYIERAEELNDEVDTVPFGLETDDGQIVKVYVNAEQADKFEEAMKNMLGLEDDIEEAINRLTTEFDIVDVVWPKSEDGEGEDAADQNLEIDDTSNLQIDAEDEEDFAPDNYDVVATTDPDETKQEKKSKDGEEEEDEIAAAAAEDEDGEGGDDDDGGGSGGGAAKKKKSSDDESDEEDEEPVEDEEEEEELDDEGKPIKKKKKKKAQPAEPVEDGDDVRQESADTYRVQADETKGRIFFEGNKRDCNQWIEEMSDLPKYKDFSFRLVKVSGGLDELAEDTWKTANSIARKKFGKTFLKLDANEMKTIVDFQRLRKYVRDEGISSIADAHEDDMRLIFSRYSDILLQLNEKAERTADSPSIAAALKLMTSKGLHISSMDEDDDGVYIEDDKGDEYVLRGDKKLTKEKHGKKLTSLAKREKVQENNMTIGSKFLSRVLQEAPEDKDGVKDGFNIPLDSQARALVAKLKLPFAKRLIAFHVMAGVPGRYLNTEDTEGTIAAAADMLRKKVSVRRAFTALYDGLANAKGFAPPPEGVNEAKKPVDPEKVAKARDAVKAAKKALADHNKTYDGGTGARAKKLQADIDAAMGKLNKLKEGIDVDVVQEASRQKRGSFIQKLFETVLVELGLPQTLITTTGPAAVGTGIYRTAELIEQDATLERALRLLATRLGIKQSDAAEQVPEGKQVSEAVDVGNDEFSMAVVSLVSALGIPDDVLQRRRTQIVQALRQKKATLRNRAQVLTMMERLQGLLQKNEVQAGGQPDNTNDTPQK